VAFANLPKPPDVYAVTLRFGDSSLAERNQSRRLRAQAESQIKLLTEAEGIFEGDFYSYRYFAAEGFLPGYSFPRLPLSAYVPGRRQRRGRKTARIGGGPIRSMPVAFKSDERYLVVRSNGHFGIANGIFLIRTVNDATEVHVTS
jgi:hypothetical protein